MPQASFLFGPTARAEFPEVKNFCRIISLGSLKVKKGNEWIDEEGIHFADPAVFNLLTFEFTEGRASDAVSGVNTVAISQSFAKKYFGNANVIGNNLVLSVKGKEEILTVTSVFADLPGNTSIKLQVIGNLDFGKSVLMKMLISYSTGEQAPSEWKDSWDHTFYTNLLQVAPNTNIHDLENKINRSFKKYQPAEDNFEYSLQAYNKIYLHSDEMINDSWQHGKLSNIYIFAASALLILLIACCNYLILSLAQSEKRAREIGIRKVSGAGFRTLLRQVLLESATISLISLPLAIGITELLIPLLNYLLDKELAIHYSQNIAFIIGVVTITLSLSVFSGLYIAWYLNKFNPVEILRGRRVKAGARSAFLKTLVVLQITIFIVLIISSLTIVKQLSFVVNYNPGINPKNVLILNLNDFTSQINYNALKQELEALPQVQSVSAALFIPPTNSKMSIQVNRVDDPSKKATLEAVLVDYNFIETLGLTITEGRSFSADYPSDKESVVINESAIKELGLKEVIGAKTPVGTVIGVVKDFHLHDLHSTIVPAYMSLHSQTFYRTAVKTKTDPATIIPNIEKIWSKVNPDVRFECTSLIDHINGQYKSEQRLGHIIITFTIVAILIAAMGLFGLANFITQLRTKEIGIRKVNGGTIFQMILLFWKELVLGTVVASLVASPIAWYFMHGWLENFAYKTTLGGWIFILAGAIALFIALVTVSWQAYKSATKNPVSSLRYE
jgi:putative ABC transport system permease protein